MIPKVIHYCWFGRNPLPALAVKCIDSWKRYLPDYEIKEWNEDNFDINIIPYTQEAYRSRKYAFVSDYARFWILYNYGGLYFDTDVEVIKPMDDIICKGSFMGRENMLLNIAGGHSDADKFVPINPGLGLGAIPNLSLYKEILDFYASLHFVLPNGSLNTTTVVQYVTEILCRYGLRNENVYQECMDIHIYPKEYFCPKSYDDGKIYLTGDTYSIHHFAASWLSPKQRMIQIIKTCLGRKLSTRLSMFYKQFTRRR